MFKQLLDALKQVVVIANETQRNTNDIKAVEQQSSAACPLPKMIETNSELYVRVRKIISTLFQNGFKRQSDDLESALSISNVAGEIFVHLGRQLYTLKNDKTTESLSLAKDCQEALDYIDKALKAIYCSNPAILHG